MMLLMLMNCVLRCVFYLVSLTKVLFYRHHILSREDICLMGVYFPKSEVQTSEGRIDILCEVLALERARRPYVSCVSVSFYN